MKELNEKIVKLIKAYDEYIELLIKELNEVSGMAWVHGWRSTRIKAGEKSRSKIKKLKLAIEKFIDSEHGVVER